MPEPLPPPPAIDDGPKEAKPAWRTVNNYRQERKDRKSKAPKAIAPAAPDPIPAPQPQVPAWAQWKRSYCVLSI